MFKGMHFGILVAGLAAFTGCSHKDEVVPQTASMTITATSPGTTTTTTTASNLTVDDAIVRTCGLPTPHFAFDSATVQPNSDTNLNKVAECFSTGPLAGRHMRLVGRADPRGETEYNLALGQRRAGEVGNYIQARGVASDRISTLSRGALDATGATESGFAEDRRVDIGLAD
jgi:peptidoglycan-associated lipoprotein